jgi:hypothetical protein
VLHFTGKSWLSRLAVTLPLLVANLTSTGCTVCYNLRRTQCTEPRQFSWKRDHATSVELYSEWADQAWREVGQASAPSTSKNYRWGFHDGFVELTYAGGNGEPPGAPPRPFWRAGWRTGAGKQAADEWFAGYRHGAFVAREGGYRDQAVIRSSAASAGFLSPGDGFAATAGSPYSPGPILEFPAGISPEAIEPGQRIPDAPAGDGADDSSPTGPGPLPPPEQLLDELEQSTSALDRIPTPVSLVSHAQDLEPVPEMPQTDIEQRRSLPSATTTIEFCDGTSRSEPRSGKLPPRNPFR